MVLHSMEKDGVTRSSTNHVIAELAGNWSIPNGGPGVGKRRLG